MQDLPLIDLHVAEYTKPIRDRGEEKRRELNQEIDRGIYGDR